MGGVAGNGSVFGYITTLIWKTLFYMNMEKIVEKEA
jgi:hypothetical protein